MKCITLKRIILIVGFLIIGSGLYAQLDSSDFNYNVNFIADQTSISGNDTLYFHQIDLTLLDTVNVSKIAVKIGTSVGFGDVESYDFVFDVNTFLPAGYSYYRNQNQLHLVLDKHAAGIYYFEVKLFDTNGIGTTPKKWNLWNQ